MKKPASIPRRKQETILIVDDDASVREVLTRVLDGEGYLVLSAGNGPEALRIAAANPIDLVLLDLNMPMQSGWDTFEELTTHNPSLGVIIVTARSGQLFTSLAAGVAALLEKPLDYPKMLQTVRAVLAESPEVRLARMVGQHGDLRYLASGGKEI